jgi:hypothetical protein
MAQFCLTLDVVVSITYVKCASSSKFAPTVGTDLRKAIVDGYPVHNVIASDLRQGGFT